MDGRMEVRRTMDGVMERKREREREREPVEGRRGRVIRWMEG